MGLKEKDVAKEICIIVNEVLDFQQKKKGAKSAEQIFSFPGTQYSFIPEMKELVEGTIERVKKSKK